MTALVLATCFMCAGCSYLVDFVVVNRTDEPVVVEYQVSGLDESHKQAPLRLDGWSVPAKMKLGEWDDDFKHDNWRICPDQEYEFNPETSVVRIHLGPQIALRIARTSDGVFFGDGYKRFPVSRLSISGASGKVMYEGFQLFAQFSERSYGHRFITYNVKPPSN